MGVLGHNARWRRDWITGIIGVLILVVVAGCDAGTTRTVTIVNAAPTAIPTATVTPTTTPYNYFYSLKAPDSGWGTDQNCFFGGYGYSGGYGFHVKPNLACPSPARNLGDVNVFVNVRPISAAITDENGLEVRRSGNPASLYEFDIAANGTWLFKLCVGGFASCRILTSGSSQAIHTGIGADNTIEVFARGAHFSLFVNYTQVGQVDDATLASGDVWLATDGTSEGVFTYFLARWP